MGMQVENRGRCACGLQGEWTDHGPKRQSRTRKATITAEDGTTHESTWAFHGGTGQQAGSKGHCHATGKDSHNPDGSPRMPTFKR